MLQVNRDVETFKSVNRREIDQWVPASRGMPEDQRYICSLWNVPARRSRKTTSGWNDQAIKGAWWMSWRPEAMKDVGTCDKPRGVGNQTVILGFLNEETHP